MWAASQAQQWMPSQGPRHLSPTISQIISSGAWDPHNVATYYPETLPLCGIGIHVIPHLIRALVLDLNIPHVNLISDKEKPVLDMVAVFASARPTIISSRMVDLLS